MRAMHEQVLPDARKKIRDKEAASRSLQALKRLSIKRLIVGHGEIIEEAPFARMVEAWRLEGVE